jgi:hypothetical protein
MDGLMVLMVLTPKQGKGWGMKSARRDGFWMVFINKRNKRAGLKPNKGSSISLESAHIGEYCLAGIAGIASIWACQKVGKSEICHWLILRNWYKCIAWCGATVAYRKKTEV